MYVLRIVRVIIYSVFIYLFLKSQDIYIGSYSRSACTSIQHNNLEAREAMDSGGGGSRAAAAANNHKAEQRARSIILHFFATCEVRISVSFVTTELVSLA